MIIDKKKQNKFSIGVVILNYLAYEESINITEQFLELPSNNVNLHIVIVDNYSNNESYNVLLKKFAKNERVTVVQTAKNLGFANSNNFGYFELLKHAHPDFVIFSNSDIILKDNSIFDWIVESYRKYNFAILGPSVYSLSGKLHQSPCENRNTSLVWNRYQLYKLYMITTKLRILKLFPFLSKRVVYGTNKPKLKQRDEWCDYTTYTESKTLHGSFLIMSQKYLKEYDTPFDTGTFLYIEEDLLKYRCVKKNLRMVFSPRYEVDHKQAVSTKKVSNSQINRDLLRRRNEINSVKRYIQVIKEKG